MSIKALYTETLAEFLERNESSSPWQAIKRRFNLMSQFNVGGEFDRTFYELFIEKYDVREIGAETDSMFYHFLNETLSEILIKYRPKIVQFVNNFNDLFKRSVSLEYHDDNKYYLNPVNTQADKLQNRTKYDGSKEQSFAFLTSNPRMMQELLDIKDIYYEALEEFEKCFMGVF
jgi:hypothetical protein